MITPFDFVRNDEDAVKLDKLYKAKLFVKQALALPFGTPIEKFLAVRAKVIADLAAAGYDGAEQIVDECFPSLKENE
jgi:hypothetical protein